jgi:hypothetical protein
VPIREILKKEIYSGDKESFCSVKTKAQLRATKANATKSRMTLIRFVNATCAQLEQITLYCTSVDTRNSSLGSVSEQLAANVGPEFLS